MATEHRVRVLLNGRPLGTIDWDNGDRGQHVVFDNLPASKFDAVSDRLTIEVPKRRIGDDDRPAIDVVLLNWIEVVYPRSDRLDGRQTVFTVAGGEGPVCLELKAASAARPLIYRDDGVRIAVDAGADDATEWHLVGSALEWPEQSSVTVVTSTSPSPDWIESRSSVENLRDVDRQVDYIMLAHPRLIEATKPLADFHRQRGLTVELVDIRQVYDSFNHGIVHPRAIRDFLEFAHGNWAAPAPRFVLLVGDASWDPRNPVADDANYVDKASTWKPKVCLPKNKSSPYAESSELNHRNLIPTWSFPIFDGDAASDNWFVAFGEKELEPQMAIGRFPVTEPREVEAVVAKTIGHVRASEPGPWRRRVLWITNEQDHARARSDRLASEMEQRGYESVKVYPTSAEPSNEQHQVALRNAFDQGQSFVHFYGHGGRYIWRTGPPDFKKNHDLFTLDDVDRLAANEKLPIILSMTCYSAPFDHPNADSIGEKFLRVPNRGAVAIIAAAWRNGPTEMMSRRLLAEMTRPGTVGEAMMRAKRGSSHRDFISQYNLLGDPALPLAVPELKLDMTWAESHPPTVQGRVDMDAFSGDALIDWLGADGEVLHTQQTVLEHPRFEAIFDGEPEGLAELVGARVFVSDARLGQYGIGWVSLAGEQRAELDATPEGAGERPDPALEREP
jgi:hypothetical protein